MSGFEDFDDISKPTTENNDQTTVKNTTIENITIQTHDKRFHVDDVAAISILGTYYNNHGITIHLVRSRDAGLMSTSDILVDVGSIYDPDTHRYDHHQKSCDEVFGDGFEVQLSSVGMIWKHFGKEFLKMYIESKGLNIDNDQLDSLWKEVYVKCIQEIDGRDNGIVPINGGVRNYHEYMNLGSIISAMNTENTDDDDGQLNAFQKAVELFGKVFEIKLETIVRNYFKYQEDYKIVVDLYNNTNNQYLILYVKIHTIHKCLNQIDHEGRIKFIVHYDSKDNQVTIRTRSRKDDFYSPMVPIVTFSEAVDKLNDEVVFIHNNLFIGKTKTLEGAIKLIQLSLDKNQRYSFKMPTFKPANKDWMVKVGLLSAGVIGGVIGANMLGSGILPKINAD